MKIMRFKIKDILISMVFVVLAGLFGYMLYSSCSYTASLASNTLTTHQRICSVCNCLYDVPQYQISLIRRGVSAACLNYSVCRCNVNK